MCVLVFDVFIFMEDTTVHMLLSNEEISALTVFYRALWAVCSFHVAPMTRLKIKVS